ncbi:MAG: cobaltochelatase subunit CobN [bacterium]
MTEVLFLTTAETDLITLSNILRDNDLAIDVTARNLLKLDAPVDFIVDRTDYPDEVLLRVVGGAEYLDGDTKRLGATLADRGVNFTGVSASGNPDKRLAQLSTYPEEFVQSVDQALQQGGVKNFKRVLMSLTSNSPDRIDVHRPPDVGGDVSESADLALLYYRANYLSGDDDFVTDVCRIFDRRGLTVEPIYVPGITRDEAMRTLKEEYLLNDDGEPAVQGVISLLGFARNASGEVPDLLASLGVPWFQLLVASRTESDWRDSSEGLESSDISMKVVFPELDGRLTGPPVSFKSPEREDEHLDTVVRRTEGYNPGIKRSARWIDSWLNLARKPNESKRVAIVLGNHPTSRARIGNGVGLDTPASLMNLLESMKQAGYKTGTLPDDSQTFMDYLVDNGSYTSAGRPPERPADFVSARQYRGWFEELPDRNQNQLLNKWGDPSRSNRFSAGFSIPGVRMGNLLVGIQPPRGFEDQSEAVYHDPELPPPHLYVAFYRWINRQFDADAVIHLGKHGTLEWLPGRSLALGETDWPALLLEELPFLYPFIINDPGEGTQAKRRTGAVIVDHMVAPQRRTEGPDHLEGLREALEDDNPGDVRSELHENGMGTDRDLESMDDEDLRALAGERLNDIDNSATRSGLHVLGELPDGRKALDLIGSLWPENEDVPDVEVLRELIDGNREPETQQIKQLLEDLHSIDQELDSVLEGLKGNYVQPGPSGAPTDGRPDLLPTGRNFYSRDARGMPTQEAWETGWKLAEKLIRRYQQKHGSYPADIGLVLWGTSNMRTGGEDVAQALALMGVRPVWTESGRVDGVEVISERELDRPRIDPLVRISGFFRDAFPNLISLLQEGVKRASSADSSRYPNFLAENNRRVGEVYSRLFGSRPENYGAGLLSLIETGDWHGHEDLTEAFLEWGKYAYDRDVEASSRRQVLENRLNQLDAVTQNRDNREHDLFDSDDYFQFHGGLIAASKTLSGEAPEAYVSDTSSNQVTVRTLAEESERVFHSRVSHSVWQEGMRDHGYKGGFEMAATVDYVFGYDATTGCVPDSFYETMAEDFVLDDANRAFLEEHNEHAIRDIGERLLEAVDRGLWENPSDEVQASIKRTLRGTEAVRESNTGTVSTT